MAYPHASFEGVCETSVILAPSACGMGGPSRGSCHHFAPSGRSRRSRGEFQNRRSCCYTRHFRAREVRGPFRAMRRLRSWSGSRRSRARESTAKSTFIRKTHMIWKTFFRVFAERSPTPYFYNEFFASRRPRFRNFCFQTEISICGPRMSLGSREWCILTYSNRF